MNTAARPDHESNTPPSFTLDQFLDYLQIDQAVKETLRSRVSPALTPHLPEIIDKFYERLVSNPHTKQYFKNETIVDRLKSLQHEYLKELIESPFDQNYFNKRRKIGKSHDRIGLLPRWYIGAYCVYCEAIFPILFEQFGDDLRNLESAQIALLKAIFFDMQIAMETYIENYASELVRARKEMEQKLWLEDRLLTFMMTEASDAYVGLDLHGCVTSWSQGAQRVFGYESNEILGRDFMNLAVDPEAIRELRQRAEESGSAAEPSIELKNLDGTILTADVTMTIIRDHKGAPNGASILLRDTTEIRRMAAKVKNLEQMQAMTKITAGVAHEIRTPLGVLTLTADLIADRLEQIKRADNKQRESFEREISDMLGDLQLEVERLNEIVNHYLMLSRIKRPKKTPFNLTRYMHNMVEEMRHRKSYKPIQIELATHDDDLEIEIDGDHFRRVFLNLFDNSVYAMGDDGRIRIRTQATDKGALIAFEDNGKGIAPQNMDRLFTAFETNRPGGTGLGLYLVREIVEAHHGSVSVESALGNGTTVFIQLPV